jgi:hypothetical protein
VKEWLGFGGTTLPDLSFTSAEQQAALLTCINPYVSWTEDDPDRVPAAQRTLKTVEEEDKEDKMQSRDRFARELERLTERYCSHEATDCSFEKGRRLILEKLSTLLRSRIDGLVMNDLRQTPKGVASGSSVFSLGMAMSRLLEPFKLILADGGTLYRIDFAIRQLIEKVKGEEMVRQDEVARAVKNLWDWTGPNLSGSGLDELQKIAWEMSAQFVASFQKRRLFEILQILAQTVRERFAEWAASIQRVFDGFDLAGFTEVSSRLRILGGRLARLAASSTALISCAERDVYAPVDLNMQGYREVLRSNCVLVAGGASLAEEELVDSHWLASLDAHGRPQIHLAIRMAEIEHKYNTESMATMHRKLYARYREHIDARMNQYDIFDYVRYAQEPPHSVTIDRIAELLNRAAQVLIDADSRELCSLIYREPMDLDKRELIRAIGLSVSRKVGRRNFGECHHSDQFSLTLLKTSESSLDAIQNIQRCREDYLKWQQANRNGNPQVDEQLFRAQVQHPFRPELEAWYIERRHALLSGRRLYDHIPPRVVRLLEDPAMMQAFVYCVATGAVGKVDGNWIWHDTANNRQVVLAERESEADLIRAAVVFVLQRREGRRHGQIPIRLEDARRSATEMAQAQGRRRDELIKEFIENRLDSYLDEHFSPRDDEEAYRRERGSLRMIFEFYSHSGTGAELSDRLALSYDA